MAEANGFCYMRDRYYDPQVGRFVSEDPSGFGGGDVNLYAYVDSVGKPLNETNPYIYTGNNPVNRVDPSGNSWISDIRSDVFSLSGNWSYYVGVAAGAAGYVAGDLACGPLCGYVVGTAGSFVGGKVGALFDPKSAGQLNYNEPQVSYPAIKQGKCGS